MLLQTIISKLLAEVPTSAKPLPKALIAPQEGCVYSGRVAATAFAPRQCKGDLTPVEKTPEHSSSRSPEVSKPLSSWQLGNHRLGRDQQTGN